MISFASYETSYSQSKQRSQFITNCKYGKFPIFNDLKNVRNFIFHGQDAVKITFVGYPIQVDEIGGKIPLFHSAVIAIDPKTGSTRYYEYGRYDSAKKE